MKSLTMLMTVLLAVSTARAAEAAKPQASTNAPPAEKKEAEQTKESAEPKEERSETTNFVTIDGHEIKYRATAGTLTLKNENGKAVADVFFIAYTSLERTNLDERPVSFSFNGGPGSSSVWLHLGLLGPRRVELKSDGNLPSPPFRLVNNSECLLDQSDLVFIDPVSTGYSRPAPGEEASKFHGVDQDLESVGDFIRLYTTRFNRWLSPKFLIGESYGTTRAAGLSGYLEHHYGMYLNGIVLVSAVLNFETISPNAGNDLPYVLFLPSETAAAWFHKKLPKDLLNDRAKALAESEKFALGDYSHALAQGSALSHGERAKIRDRLARLMGLSPDYIDRANLRVAPSYFMQELLREQRLTIGRYDSRITGPDEDAISDSPEYDPSFTSALGPFSATFNDYVRRDLKYKSDLPYEILNSRVFPWDFRARNEYLDVAQTLREAMIHNPYLKVFVANGRYDLATPYLATRYTFDHMALPSELRRNVTMGYYDAGHMMYVNEPSRVQLKKDLAQFIQEAVPPR